LLGLLATIVITRKPEDIYADSREIFVVEKEIFQTWPGDIKYWYEYEIRQAIKGGLIFLKNRTTGKIDTTFGFQKVSITLSVVGVPVNYGFIEHRDESRIFCKLRKKIVTKNELDFFIWKIKVRNPIVIQDGDQPLIEVPSGWIHPPQRSWNK